MDDLKPLEPTLQEQFLIDELLRFYPKLDYLMALVLVKSTDEEREQIIKQGKPKPQIPSSTVIKDAVCLI